LRESRPDLRVLFMSGYTEDVIAPHGVLEDGTDFIEKPFGVERLARKVREVLDR
jgi:two-component system cell cycle sensor histidine kinase/response regulator CckA